MEDDYKFIFFLVLLPPIFWLTCMQLAVILDKRRDNRITPPPILVLVPSGIWLSSGFGEDILFGSVICSIFLLYYFITNGAMKVSAEQEVERALQQKFRSAEKSGESEITISSGDLYAEAGYRPDLDKRMLVFRNVMCRMAQKGDDIYTLFEGGDLYITYMLPRKK